MKKNIKKLKNKKIKKEKPMTAKEAFHRSQLVLLKMRKAKLEKKLNK